VEVVALIVSLLAVGISFGSLLLAARADRRAYRAEHRDEVRLEREEAEAAERRRGRPVVEPMGGFGGPTAETVHHDYLIRNGGNAAIAEVWLWIADGEGNVVSTREGGQFALVPSDDGVHLSVRARRPLPDEQELMVQWRDADGEHTESTGIRPPPAHGLP
jgi:hypothetical protein